MECVLQLLLVVYVLIGFLFSKDLRVTTVYSIFHESDHSHTRFSSKISWLQVETSYS